VEVFFGTQCRSKQFEFQLGYLSSEFSSV